MRKVIGGGLSGLSFAYLASLEDNATIIYERRDEESWRKINEKPYVIKPSHLRIIEQHAPRIFSIIKKIAKPIYRVKKIVINFEGNKSIVFNYESRRPIFHVINALNFFCELVKDDDLKIRFNEVNDGRIRAEGGALWGNILGLGKVVEEDVDEIILWYDQTAIPGGYVFKAPIPGRRRSLIMTVIFDPDKYLYKIPSLVQPIEIIIKTGYTTPRLVEGKYITIGERAGG